MKDILRSDKKYKEIENFKDYELTQCIAYEMATRNPEVKKLVAEQATLWNWDSLPDDDMKSFEKTKSIEEMRMWIPIFWENNPQIRKEYMKYLELRSKINDLSYFHIAAPITGNFYRLLKNPAFNAYLKNPSQREQAEKSKSIRNEDLSIHAKRGHDGTASTELGGKMSYADLYPKLSREIPNLPVNLKKELDIPINLVLPLDDILSYVKAIKMNYDKSNGEAFKSASPVKEILEIDKDIFSIQIKMKQKGSDTKLTMPDKRQQEVYADLLFLYDFYTDSSNKNKRDKYLDFRKGLIDHYANKVCKYHGIKDIDDVSEYISTPNEHTARKYFKMMKAYIEEYGYKQLLV